MLQNGHLNYHKCPENSYSQQRFCWQFPKIGISEKKCDPLFLRGLSRAIDRCHINTTSMQVYVNWYYHRTIFLIEGLEETKLAVSPRGQSLSVLLYLPSQKNARKWFALRRLAHNFAAVSRSTTWSRASAESLDQQHVTRFPPIGQSIWVGRYNNID